MRDLATEEAVSFWEFVTTHELHCEFHERAKDDKGTLWLYIDISYGMDDILDDFGDQYPYVLEEDGINVKLWNSGIGIDVAEFMCGWGFTMKELWEMRPDELRDNEG